MTEASARIIATVSIEASSALIKKSKPSLIAIITSRSPSNSNLQCNNAMHSVDVVPAYKHREDQRLHSLHSVLP